MRQFEINFEANRRKARTDYPDWKTEIRARMESPLRVREIATLMCIVPGASGDVALSTAVLNHVKELNPNCHVKFATRKANVPLARACPVVDEVRELPTEFLTDPVSRRRMLQSFRGAADAVIVPICNEEDLDLLWRYSLMETLWLLSGIEDGIPGAGCKVWLSAPPIESELTAVVSRYTGSRGARKIGGLAIREFKATARGIRGRLLGRGASVRAPAVAMGKLSRMIAPTIACSKAPFQGGLGRQLVILSTHATTLRGPSASSVARLVSVLRSSGRTILHNVMCPSQAAIGTVPLVCSYGEFLGLRSRGVPFIGWRNGLCDIAAASSAPMCVIYPAIWIPGFRTPFELFSFTAMNVRANCVEIECSEDEMFDELQVRRFLASADAGII